jgi:crotonobetainyl-CoA:carnitine CoA-transferase CaiB-like acyl-CoA transferase
MGAGLASIFAASGGLSVQTGYPDGPPTEVGDPMDYRSGTALAAAIAAAVMHRENTGQGQHVDLSSREVIIASAPAALLAYEAEVPWEPRLGNRDRSMTPQDVYPCRDGRWLALSVRDNADWTALCQVLGRGEWIEELVDLDVRRRATDRVDAAIAEWTMSAGADDAARVLLEAGVPATPVMSFSDLAADGHLAARRAFVDVEHPLLGVQRVMRAPWILSDGPLDVRRAGPLMGADTETILNGVVDNTEVTG